jgi:hypothetical protein
MFKPRLTGLESKYWTLLIVNLINPISEIKWLGSNSGNGNRDNSKKRVKL